MCGLEELEGGVCMDWYRGRKEVRVGRLRSIV